MPGQPMPGQPYGYQQPLDGPPRLDIGRALRWAWNTFAGNVLATIAAPLAMIVVFAVIGAALVGASVWAFGDLQTYTYADGTTETTGTVNTGGIVVSVLLYLVIIAVGFYFSASLVAGAIRAVDGEPLTASSFLVTRRFGAVVATSLLVAIATLIGLALCIIPGLIVIVLTQYAVYFVVDKGQSPIEAIKSSSALARGRVGDSIVLALLVYVLSAVGAILCYVGLIVTVPLSYLMLAHGYRQLIGGPIAEPGPTVGAPSPYPPPPASY